MGFKTAGRADQQAAQSERVTLLTAVGRTTAFASGPLANSGGQQLSVDLETTTVGSASLTVTISRVLPSGTKVTVLASAAVTTDTVTTLKVSPHLTASANAIAKDIVPAVFAIDVGVGGAQAATYQLSYQLGP